MNPERTTPKLCIKGGMVSRKVGLRITILGQFFLRSVKRSVEVTIDHTIFLTFVIQEEANYPEIVKRPVFAGHIREEVHNFGAVFPKGRGAKRRSTYKSYYFLALCLPRGKKQPQNCEKNSLYRVQRGGGSQFWGSFLCGMLGGADEKLLNQPG